MALTRVMLGAMPTLLGDIVRETLAGHEDIEILAEVADRGDIGPAVQRTGAQVAVVAVAPRGRSSDQGDLARELLAAHPHLKIVALTSDGRSGYVYQLERHEAAIVEEISPQSLLEAIRGACTSGHL